MGSQRRFIAGEPLRGIAALSVMAYHLVFFGPGTGGDGLPVTWSVPANDALAAGLQQLLAGLFVFFVLSGFLIGRPFVRAVVDGTTRPDPREYARRRALRIVPAFWGAAALTLLVFGTQGASFGELLAIFAFAQVYVPSEAADQIGQAWSLDVEAAFYLAVPIAAVVIGSAASRVAPGLRRAAPLLFALAIAGLVSFQLHRTGPRDPATQTLLPTFYAFVPGLVLCTIEPWAGRSLTGRRWGRLLALGLIAAGATAVLARTLSPSLSASAVDALTLCAATALVSGALVQEWNSGRSWRLLDNAVLRWLGARSYSIYLLHFGVLLWFVPRLADATSGTGERVAIALLVAAITLVLADLSHRLLERPFMRLKRRRPDAPAPAVAQAPAPSRAT